MDGIDRNEPASAGHTALCARHDRVCVCAPHHQRGKAARHSRAVQLGASVGKFLVYKQNPPPPPHFPNFPSFSNFQIPLSYSAPTERKHPSYSTCTSTSHPPPSDAVPRATL
jgi:hypothetical protein